MLPEIASKVYAEAAQAFYLIYKSCKLQVDKKRVSNNISLLIPKDFFFHFQGENNEVHDNWQLFQEGGAFK